MAPRKKADVKAAPKRSRKKVEVIDELIDDSFETSFDDLNEETSTSKRKYFIIALILLGIIALGYTFKSVFVAAMVNGQPISRLKLISELEKRQGKDVLESLITEDLINQEAKKQNIQISQDVINGEISKIEENLKSQGQTLDQVLVTQGMTKEDLEKQIRFQKIIEKALEKDLTVSDQEIADYIKTNKDLFAKDTKPEDQKAQAAEQLRQQKLSEKFQTWLDELRQNAKINYFLVK